MIEKRRGAWLLVGAGLAAWLLMIGTALAMLWAYAETPVRL